VVRAGVRAGSMFGVMKIPNTKSDYLVLKKHGAHFDEILHGLGVADHTVPYGTVLSGERFSRHFVPSYNHAVPPGPKTIRPSERVALS
jgi:hypothetical protein